MADISFGTRPVFYYLFHFDTYQQKSIKNAETLFRGSSQRYILKSPGMKLPADMQKFLRNGANKEMLFNLIEVALREGKKKIGDKVTYFSNVNHCLKITQHEVFIVQKNQVIMKKSIPNWLLLLKLLILQMENGNDKITFRRH